MMFLNICNICKHCLVNQQILTSQRCPQFALKSILIFLIWDNEIFLEAMTRLFLHNKIEPQTMNTVINVKNINIPSKTLQEINFILIHVTA